MEASILILFHFREVYGANENTNGLLRQYFPKGKRMTNYTQNQLYEVANKLNTRHGKILGFKILAHVFEEALY